jgi:hypothetical protein
MTDLRRSISRAIGARVSILHTKSDSVLPTPPHSLVVDVVTQEIHKGKTVDENFGKNQVTLEQLMQFGFAYTPPLIIAAVINKTFDPLASGAKTAEQISKETGASRRGLSWIMNALVGLELLKKTGASIRSHQRAKRFS